MITYVESRCYLVQYIGITVIYIVSGPLCTNEYLIGCLYERAHFPNYNVLYGDEIVGKKLKLHPFLNYLKSNLAKQSRVGHLRKTLLILCTS